MAGRYTVRVSDGQGGEIELRLANDPQTGLPLFKSEVLDPIQPTVQVGEASYASFLPRESGVYSQHDLSGGMGKRIQAAASDPDANRYYYAEQLDASVAGQVQKGPAVTLLTPPANSGPLSGFFVLGGTPYLVLGRKIASWASDSLTERHDFGVGNSGTSGATFFKLGPEASIESQTTRTNNPTIDDPNEYYAQSFRIDDTGVRFLSRIDLWLQRNSTVPGNVRLRIQTDQSGRPSGETLATINVIASNVNVASGGTLTTFRLDETDLVPVAYNEPLWLVLDVVGSSTGVSIEWYDDNGTNTYPRGTSSRSTDAGTTWTDLPGDLYFELYARTPTATAFVGEPNGTNPFKTTTDGAVYTADAFRSSSLFCLAGDRLARDVRAGDGTSGVGIQLSEDGVNWGSVILLGDVSIRVTALLEMGGVLIVVKEDSIWALDLGEDEPVPEPLFRGGKVSTNGQGATVWKNVAYIPFDGRLMAVSGDFGSAGFTVHQSVGPESLPEWDSPWGAGRVQAVAGDRFHLYAAMSITSPSGGSDNIRLLKSADPLASKWHGSLVQLGEKSILTMLAIYEPGGDSSPELFCTMNDNQVGRIRLPRSANPASDTNYRYDTTAVGQLFYPRAHGNFHVHNKAWLTEAVTFRSETSGDSVRHLYDTEDGEGFRLLGGPLFQSGVLHYPEGLLSRLLARQTEITLSTNTDSPLLLASGLTYAVRSAGSSAIEGLRTFTFTVEAGPGLSAQDLGDLLGTDGEETSDALYLAAASGTRTLWNPWGRPYPRVLFTDIDDTFLRMQEDGPVSAIVVRGVQIG